jgi:hypothetical protein
VSSVRDTARIIVDKPVPNRIPARGRDPEHRPRATRARIEAVHPAVMAAAEQVLRPGQRIRIVSPFEVVVENRPGVV